MKLNKIVGLICAIVIAFVPFTLGGCNGGNTYEYSDLQTLYNEIVNENSDIFANDGRVKVVYNNASLNNVILTSSANSQFNKLSGDSTKTYAIFEPTFGASLLVVNEFIKKPCIDQSKFDKKASTQLYNELLTLEAKIADFKDTKAHLEARSTIDVNNATVKSWRNDLFAEYYAMIDVACDFALNFAGFYEKNVLGEKKVGDRYVSNYMKLEYLTIIAEHARITTDTVIKANYNRIVENLDTSVVTKLVNLYNTIPQKSWASTGTTLITEEEKAVMQALDTWKKYELVFYQGKTILYNAINMVDYNAIMYQNKVDATQLSVEDKNVIAQVERFFDCECGNMYSYLNSFTAKLNTFLSE